MNISCNYLFFFLMSTFFSAAYMLEIPFPTLLNSLLTFVVSLLNYNSAANPD